MSTNDLPSDEKASFYNESILHGNSTQQQGIADTKKSKEVSIDFGEQKILIYSSIGLSILGLFAFLITGQVAVVLAMNAPLLAIIGRSLFSR